MTLNEAKAVIYGNVVYACEKAGLAPQTTRLVQDACDTIIALADRKTENSSEIPNNSTISKMEQVDEPSGDNLSPVEDEQQITMDCSKCERYKDGGELCDFCAIKDEPQTEVYDYKGNGKWERSE